MKLTLKRMNEIASEYGMTATEMFNHGLHYMLASKEGLKADRENPIKYQIDRIIHNLGDIQIAENILREWYGIEFCDISKHQYGKEGKLQVHCGIDELSQALGVEPKEKNEWSLAKEFDYSCTYFVQLAERNSTNYLKAFEGHGHYSTNHEKAYE